MADIIAETDRLILRTIDDGDAVLQDRLLNTPTVMARLGGVKELHEIEAKHAKAQALYARDGFGFLMMIEKDTGELVGHCGLKRVDYPRLTRDAELFWEVTAHMADGFQLVCFAHRFESALSAHIDMPFTSM